MYLYDTYGIYSMYLQNTLQYYHLTFYFYFIQLLNSVELC